MPRRTSAKTALDELGYIPNRAPDILSNATSRAVGVLLPSLTTETCSGLRKKRLTVILVTPTRSATS
jgi:DNA-binding LacI/PurR family transcriptional regulator